MLQKMEAMLKVGAMGAMTVTLSVPAVFATDGVLEISEHCVAEGCFSGDAPGYPVEIANPGSYKLTTDLVRDSSNLTAHHILITADRVTLDLNGFSIVGPVTCSVAGDIVTSCASTGAGAGVFASSRRYTTVRNGSIVGTAGCGIEVENSKQTRIEGITIRNSGDTEAALQASSSWDLRVIDSAFIENLGTGVASHCSGMVSGSVFRGNKNRGLETSLSCTNFGFVNSVFSLNGIGNVGSGATDMGNNFCLGGC